MEEQKTIIKFCALNLNTTPPNLCTILRPQTEDNKSSNIVVKFKFRQFLEVHDNCEYCLSDNHPQDHNIISRELVEDSLFVAALAFPLKPETVEYYMAGAHKVNEGWPNADYATPTVWDKVEKSVAEYILKKADFESKIGFEMWAKLDVSTLLNGSCCCESYDRPHYYQITHGWD